MTSTEESGNVQIIGLPDDLLMEIFSYVTFIPTKMYLEQVCKRFHFVSSRPASWKGIHKLEMTMICKFKFDEGDCEDSEIQKIQRKLFKLKRMIDLQGSSADSDSENYDDDDAEIDYKMDHLDFLRDRPGYKYYFNIYMEGDENRIEEAVNKWPDLEQACDYDDDKVVLAVKRMIKTQGCGMKGSRMLLNGINVPFTKWSNAIQSLLERTNIHQLIIHNRNDDNDAFSLDPTQLPSLIIGVLQRNVHKMKLNSIECHLNVGDWTALAMYQLSSILIKSLRISVPHLEEFAFSVKGMNQSTTGSFPKIWPVLKKCNCLKSISFDSDVLSVDLTALISKPLTKLAVYNNAGNIPDPVGDPDLDNLIEVMNNAEGIQSLIPTGLQFENNAMPFQYFCNHLNENSRKKLKYIKADFIKPVEINHLNLVPSIFPNLETIEIIVHVPNYAVGIAQLCTMVVSFFNVANAESSNCKMKLESLNVAGDDWQMNLLLACQNAEINIEFDNPSPVFMSKGSASIKIDRIEIQLVAAAMQLGFGDDFE